MKKRTRQDNLQPLKPMRDKALTNKPLCVKIDQDIAQVIRALPETSTWLREVIETAAIAQGLVKSDSDRTDISSQE